MAGINRGKRRQSLADMQDVAGAGAGTNDALVYDAGSAKWKPKRLQLASGGTGATAFTPDSAVVVDGTGTRLASLSNGSAGQVLVASGGGGACSYQTITGTAPISVTSAGTGTIGVAQTGQLDVAHGGTQTSSLALDTPIVGGGVGAPLQSVAAPTASNQLLVSQGSGGGVPVYRSVGATAPVSVTNGVAFGLTNPLPVASGGTGVQTPAPANQPLCAGAQGTSAVQVVTPGTSDGQLLVSYTSAGQPPAYCRLSGSDPVVVSQATGGGDLTVGLVSKLSSAQGGTNAQTFANANQPVCCGSTFSSVSAGSAGQVLVSQTSGVPSFQTVSPSAPLAMSTAGGLLTFGIAPPSLSVSQGGTGRTAFADANQPVCSGGTSSTAQLQTVAGGTSAGQVLVSRAAGSVPGFQTVVPTLPLQTTAGAGGVTLSLATPVAVQSGGTERSSFLDLNQPVCAGSSTAGALQVVTATTNSGFPLVSQGTGNVPIYRQATGSGVVKVTSDGTNPFTVGLTGTLGVGDGGTGVSTGLALNQPVCAGTNGGGALQSVAQAAAGGYLLVSGTAAGGLPSFQPVTATPPASISSTGGTVTFGLENPLTVANRGTGLQGFSTNSLYQPVCAGSGTQSQLQAVLSTTSAGRLLLSQTGSGVAPVYGPLSGGGPIGVTSAGSTITCAFENPLTVPNGGTGLTSLTAYGLLCGGTSTNGQLQLVAPVASGSVLVSQSAAKPAFRTISASAPLTLTDNGTTLSLGLTQPLTVGVGGTGATGFTANRLLLSGTAGTGAVTNLATTGNSGDLLTSVYGGAPVWAAPASITFTVFKVQSASGTYTPTDFVKYCVVEMWGAGGGGGGCVTASGNTYACGGGGGGGEYVTRRYTAAEVAGGVACGVGTGGSGGSTAGGNGGTGSNTTFGTLTATGGSGGTGCTAYATSVAKAGGAGGHTDPAGDPAGTIRIDGQDGEYSFAYWSSNDNATWSSGGRGGNSIRSFGAGIEVSWQGGGGDFGHNGTTGATPGGGGSGGSCYQNNGPNSGGGGGGGRIVITEFI